MVATYPVPAKDHSGNCILHSPKFFISLALKESEISLLNEEFVDVLIVFSFYNPSSRYS